MTLPSLQLAYYADDFTGATDALEWLERAGVRSALFLNVPTPEQLARLPDVMAIGVAGRTRALPPDVIESQLRNDFQALKALQPRLVHYKVCSTFDSSPQLGSIGRAIDVGMDVFGSAKVPVVGGAPALGRYCVFGNLFAVDGIGSNRGVHRLDRHPVMSRHPVTPAEESDLRQHLARQTTRAIGHLDIRHLDSDQEVFISAWHAQPDDAVLIDALTAEHVARIGDLLVMEGGAGSSFVVGPSSVEQALGFAWAGQGRIRAMDAWRKPAAARPLLVVSGSCSEVTERQIAAARASGFAEVTLAPSLLETSEAARTIEHAANEAVDHLVAGRHVIVHTLGNGRETRVSPATLGRALGGIAAIARQRSLISRLIIAGGDTSGEVARALGIEALELIAPLTPGAPLCRVRASQAPVDGLEVVVKGGQVGPDDHFERVAKGHS